MNDANLDALFEAGCSDATVGQRGGVSYADFNREADTFAAAVQTATEAIAAAFPGAGVVGPKQELREP